MSHPPIPLAMATPRHSPGSGILPEPVSWKILVVDDEQAAHDFTRHAVRNITFEGRPVVVLDAYSGREAVLVCQKHPDLAVILLDVVMESRHAGLEVVRHIRETLGMRTTRIVLNTGQPGNTNESDVVAGYDINDYRNKIELTPERTRSVMTHALRAYRDCCAPGESTLELLKARALNSNLRRALAGAHQDMTRTIFRILNAKSRETADHVRSMGAMVHKLGLLIGQEPAEAARLGQAAQLHDVGKIGVPDEILNKPGPLSPRQHTIMQRHTVLGREILRYGELPLLRDGAVIAHQHHERWDGHGYPCGLKGREIHLFGRMAAVCDVFDALSRSRIYRAPWPPDQVLEYMKEQRGRTFDPDLLDIVLVRFEEFLEIQRAGTLPSSTPCLSGEST